jgi:hypothetical protein
MEIVHKFILGLLFITASCHPIKLSRSGQNGLSLNQDGLGSAQNCLSLRQNGLGSRRKGVLLFPGQTLAPLIRATRKQLQANPAR